MPHPAPDEAAVRHQDLIDNEEVPEVIEGSPDQAGVSHEVRNQHIAGAIS